MSQRRQLQELADSLVLRIRTLPHPLSGEDQAKAALALAWWRRATNSRGHLTERLEYARMGHAALDSVAPSGAAPVTVRRKGP